MEDSKQVGTVNHGDGPAAWLQRFRGGAREPQPGGVTDAGLGLQRAPLANQVACVERIQCPQAIGPERQASTHFGECCRALKDLDVPAVPDQRQRRSQAANAAAYDDRFPLIHGSEITRTSRSWAARTDLSR